MSSLTRLRNAKAGRDRGRGNRRAGHQAKEKTDKLVPQIEQSAAVVGVKVEVNFAALAEFNMHWRRGFRGRED
jgi:hypothetical protein